MNTGEAAAVAGASGATGAGIGVMVAEVLLDEQSAPAVVIGLSLLGILLLTLAIRLGRNAEDTPSTTVVNMVVQPPTGLDDHAPEVLFEAFQRALRRRGGSA